MNKQNKDIDYDRKNMFKGDDTRAKTPKSLSKHVQDYQYRSWDDYTMLELGSFVHLLSKRAHHRSNKKKVEKDLYDAQNYLNMMQSKLDALKENLPLQMS